MTRMTGEWVIKQSVFGKVDPDCTTLDGRNIGQMQTEAAAKIDAFIERVPQVIGQIPTRSDAVVAADQAVSQMMRRLWGKTEIDVYVERDGRKAIQGVNYRDVVATTKNYVGNIWDAAQ